MANYIDIPTFSDTRGSLCVMQDCVPFDIKRVYYIFNASSLRGGHRHHKTTQLLVCVRGSCEIYVNNGKHENLFILDEPNKGLIVEPEDWHTMDVFSDDNVLLVLASEEYNVDDYIDEKYS